ncbi:MAG TPA: alpha/beta hydrolase [Anaerolineales bacterium]|nr:alpha/beta hydrolase [Anaerolineales bacterium]HNN14771.1 alpha/beta hydrolase [Anaerolineales bacterium]HNO31901.1 alpha/beta hydrolase [Anaerolineales bacterium]
MRKLLRGLGITLAVLVILAMVVPFLIPVPPLENTVPADALTDSDSLFVKVNGVNVHYKTYGEGPKTFILLHGFGASIFSWREVTEPLSKYGMVIAYDRPAFGLTERPMEWEGENPYSQEAQVDLVIGLMDALGVEKVTLVGNSAGGTISMLAYLQYPERIESLILVDPAVYAGGGAPAWIRPLLSTPQFDHIGPLFGRQLQAQGNEFLKTAWHDPAKITPEIFAGYQKPLQVNDWDKALWYLTLSSRESGLAEHISEVDLPALVITGDDDRIVPTEQSLRLAEELPNAQLAVIPQCGHVPHEECPAAFMQAVEEFLGPLP